VTERHPKRPRPQPNGPTPDLRRGPLRAKVPEYIHSMLEGLARVAGGAGMPFLAYLINVALEEAKVEKATRD
jgi:hypothetical protein